MRGIQGKIAIVTGAGSGMGKATALRFASEGATVIAADVTGTESDTASENPDSIVAVHCDVTQSSDVEHLVAEAMSQYGRLDVMCNVVGVAGIAQGLIADIDEAEYDEIVAINMKSCFLGMKYAIPAIAQGGGGSVINWSSTGALSGSGSTGPYSATKAAVIALTKAAARGYGPAERPDQRHLPRLHLPHRDDADGSGALPGPSEAAHRQGRPRPTGPPQRHRRRGPLPGVR